MEKQYKFTKNLDGYTFKAPSRVKGKKYDVFKNDKKIASFGALGYQQYTDKIGYYKSLNHNDLSRKKNYYSRHGKADYESPKYFSHKYLW